MSLETQGEVDAGIVPTPVVLSNFLVPDADGSVLLSAIISVENATGGIRFTFSPGGFPMAPPHNMYFAGQTATFQIDFGRFDPALLAYPNTVVEAMLLLGATGKYCVTFTKRPALPRLI